MAAGGPLLLLLAALYSIVEGSRRRVYRFPNSGARDGYTTGRRKTEGRGGRAEGARGFSAVAST